MSIEYSMLRQIVLDHLRRIRPDEHPQINFMGNNWVESEAKSRGLNYSNDDGVRSLDIFHELYREGVIVSGARPDSSHAMTWPYFRLTEYGRKVLAEKEYVPHDPEGYLARLKSDIPGVDVAIIRYLQESLSCFKAGHQLASAVILGCASEKAMLLLIDTLAQALSDSAERDRFKGIVEKQWMIGRKYDELWKILSRKLDKLVPDLSEDLHTLLDRVFESIRAARNEAGHPTGKSIDRDAMHANLLLFPIYCRRVYGLVEFLKNNPI